MGNSGSSFCLPNSRGRAAAGRRSSETLGKTEVYVYHMCNTLKDILNERTDGKKVLDSVWNAILSIRDVQTGPELSDKSRVAALPAFLEWCEANGARGYKVRPEVFEDCGGMGIVTTQKIEKDEEVFRVSYTSMINTNDAKARGNYLTEAAGVDSAWVQVSICCFYCIVVCFCLSLGFVAFLVFVCSSPEFVA